MYVQVRLGSGLATAAGTRRLRVELPEDATVGALIQHLRDAEPSIAPALESALPVYRGVHASGVERLTEGDEIALLIPMAGGAIAGLTTSERRNPWR